MPARAIKPSLVAVEGVSFVILAEQALFHLSSRKRSYAAYAPSHSPIRGYFDSTWLITGEPVAAHLVGDLPQEVTAWDGVLLGAKPAGIVVMLGRSVDEAEPDMQFPTISSRYTRLPMKTGMGLLAVTAFDVLGLSPLDDAGLAVILVAFVLCFMDGYR